MHRRSTRTGTAATVTGPFAPRPRPGTRPCARTSARGRSSSSGAPGTVGYNGEVSRLVVSVLVAFLALTAGADGARRDGDPASDVLIYRNVYLPYRAPSQAAAAALNGEVKQVFARGYRIKVAVIAQKIDLGSIPSLYDKPADYARFLGQELSSFYVGPLLIAMPAGFGIYDGGRSTAAEARVLAGVAVPRSAKPDDLAGATTTAVSRLLQAGALKLKDILPPYTAVLRSTLKQGVLTTVYQLFDDSGRARVTLTVTRRGKVLLRSHAAMHATDVQHPEQIRSRVPAGVSLARANACVVGIDPSGNRSAPACTKVAHAR